MAADCQKNVLSRARKQRKIDIARYLSSRFISYIFFKRESRDRAYYTSFVLVVVVVVPYYQKRHASLVETC